MQLSARSTFPLVLLLLATPLGAQDPTPDPAPVRILSLPALGGPEDDAWRTRELLEGTAGGYLLRSPSTTLAAREGEARGPTLGLFAPQVDAVYNSALPSTLNDGWLWAGRGMTYGVTAGARLRWGPLTLTVAPHLAHIENADFRVVPSAVPGRSAFASPYHRDPWSIDAPTRFGNQALTVVDPGQSTLSLRLGAVEVGASTENEWWGPGLRNAIVMSDNAAGVPRVFARTAEPVRTPLGELRARWFVGALTESLYFDADSTNDTRSLSALAVTLRPSRELTLGVARAVYGVVPGPGRLNERALDVFTHWRSPADPEEEEGEAGPAREQVTSLFGRWVFPADRFEVFGEWARVELPRSPGDFLRDPHHTQGYTLGLQWLGPPVWGAGRVRLQGEATNLEQSSTFRQREVPGYYVSAAIPQGYTQRGQSVGAAIGPGASSQWLAADVLSATRRLGAFAGRIRWDNDIYYTQPTGFSYASHDVSVFAGLRGFAWVSSVGVEGEVTFSKRYNYLFQNIGGGFGPDGTFDRNSLSLRVSIVPGMEAPVGLSRR